MNLHRKQKCLFVKFVQNLYTKTNYSLATEVSAKKILIICRRREKDSEFESCKMLFGT